MGGLDPNVLSHDSCDLVLNVRVRYCAVECASLDDISEERGQNLITRNRTPSVLVRNDAHEKVSCLVPKLWVIKECKLPDHLSAGSWGGHASR